MVVFILEVCNVLWLKSRFSKYKSQRGISMFRSILHISLLMIALVPFSNAASESVENALVIVTSGDTQTQGMAMVLSGAMREQGADVQILLCDAAGDMATDAYQGTALKPFDATPAERLQALINQGVVVELCALYLPNSGLSPQDIIEGVNPRAQPPQIANLMLRRDIKVFTF